MSLRREFVELARQPDVNIRALCRRFEISPKTGYKWLNRCAQETSANALRDRSRQPHAQPARSAPEIEAAVVALRQSHPAWGGRKIARRLLDRDSVTLAPSTVTAILHRHGLLQSAASEAAKPWLRFEHAAPNALWQIDFKGHFTTPAGKCHALTLIDDHSRFNLVLQACARTDADSVQPVLTDVFRRYGLPYGSTRTMARPGAAPVWRSVG